MENIRLSHAELKTAPEDLAEVSRYWAEAADFYGDKGSSVLGAGFSFVYNGKNYFMPPLTIHQGSCSWEHCKDTIEVMLKGIGAENISYEWGNMN